MKLSEWAKKNSLCYMTCYRAFKQGKIPNAFQLPSGTIVVPDVSGNNKKDYTVVYARVSSSQNRSNLKSQAKRLVEFCTANGWVVNEVIEECGSGLNDQRPKLQTLLKNNKVTRLVIEHRDRLTRFGFNYIKTLMKDCEIICVNESTEQDEDLMTDFISVVTCFCARLYGRRKTRRNTEKLIKSLREQK